MTLLLVVSFTKSSLLFKYIYSTNWHVNSSTLLIVGFSAAGQLQYKLEVFENCLKSWKHLQTTTLRTVFLPPFYLKGNVHILHVQPNYWVKIMLLRWFPAYSFQVVVRQGLVSPLRPAAPVVPRPSSPLPQSLPYLSLLAARKDIDMTVERTETEEDMTEWCVSTPWIKSL